MNKTKMEHPEHWLYSASIPEVDSVVELELRESKHAGGSKRLHAGDKVCLIDGSGQVASGVIKSPGEKRQCATVRVSSIQQAQHTKPFIHLASALPKGDRLSTMLNMATQLGIMSFIPLKSELGIVEQGKNSLDRWRRIMLEACKQSHNAYLPQISDMLSIEQAISLTGDDTRKRCVLFAHPDGISVAKAASEINSEEYVLIIGPEGGFTEREVSTMINAGAVQVDLGRNTLRIETAVVAMISAVMLSG